MESRACRQGLKDRAEQTKRTVEDETLDVLAAALPVNEHLPLDWEEAVAPLVLLDDEALWQAARSRLAESDARTQYRVRPAEYQGDGPNEA